MSVPGPDTITSASLKRRLTLTQNNIIVSDYNMMMMLQTAEYVWIATLRFMYYYYINRFNNTFVCGRHNILFYNGRAASARGSRRFFKLFFSTCVQYKCATIIIIIDYNILLLFCSARIIMVRPSIHNIIYIVRRPTAKSMESDRQRTPSSRTTRWMTALIVTTDPLYARTHRRDPLASDRPYAIPLSLSLTLSTIKHSHTRAYIL